MSTAAAMKGCELLRDEFFTEACFFVPDPLPESSAVERQRGMPVTIAASVTKPQFRRASHLGERIAQTLDELLGIDAVR